MCKFYIFERCYFMLRNFKSAQKHTNYYISKQVYEIITIYLNSINYKTKFTQLLKILLLIESFKRRSNIFHGHAIAFPFDTSKHCYKP